MDVTYVSYQIWTKASVRKTLITILGGYRGHKNVFINDRFAQCIQTQMWFILFSLVGMFWCDFSWFSQEIWFVKF